MDRSLDLSMRTAVASRSSLSIYLKIYRSIEKSATLYFLHGFLFPYSMFFSDYLSLYERKKNYCLYRYCLYRYCLYRYCLYRTKKKHAVAASQITRNFVISSHMGA